MKQSIAAIVCARMGSTRMPGKVMAELNGVPALMQIVDRLCKSDAVGRVIVATSEDSTDDEIAVYARRNAIPCFRGSLHNVMDRMWRAYLKYGEGKPYILRAMSDQPFLDWVSLDYSTALMAQHGLDFVLPLAFGADPVYGGGICPWSYRAFESLNANSTGDELEHPGMWARRNLHLFKYALWDLPHWMYRDWRLELDTEDDYKMIDAVYRELGGLPALRDVVHYLDYRPEVAQLNVDIKEKTGTYTSYTEAEIDAWHKDYSGRQIFWSDVDGIVGNIENQPRLATFECPECCGKMVVLGIVRKKSDLKTRCTVCGNERTYYAIKPKGK